jgi:hypothetical protein
VADGGVIPNDLIEDRTQAVSFLPGVTEKIPDADFEAIKRAAFSMGVMEGSFHVDDANVGIEKSLPYRFAQGMLDRGAEIKFASHLSAGKKKADFAVKPERVRMVVYDDRQDFLLPEFMDDDYTTSALIVDFDQKGIQKRDSAKEVRGIPRTKHSMVFGFTTNLEPTLNRRLRVDDLESTDRNKDLPFSEFFSDKIAKKVPARDGYSRGHDYWAKGKKMAGLGINRDLAFVNRPFVASDAANPFGFVLQPGGGAGGGAAGGGAGALSLSGLGVAPAAPAGGGSIASGPPSFGGQQGGGGGTGGGFGMPGGWGGFPMRGIGGFGGGAGGFAGGTGGGTGGGSGNGSGNATPNQQQSSNGSQQGQQIINFKATLTNQQLQQQQQFQIQEQNQHQSQENRNRNEHGHGHHNHGHHGHGHVVPAPASLLLGLLGLPGLLLLRRRKNLEATA